MFTLRDIIGLAVQIEKNGEKVYRGAQKSVSSPSVASLLEWMADEEVKHARWFSELKERVAGEPADPDLEAAGQAALSRVLGDQSFSLQDLDLSALVDLHSLITISMEFEKDTVIFFQMIKSVADDEVTRYLDVIIEEEKRHIAALEELYQNPGQAFEPPK